MVGYALVNIKARQDTPAYRIFDSKPFIDGCYSIGLRLELKDFHFAKVLLNA